MAPSRFIHTGGGLASIIAGALLPLGHLANLGGDPDYGTVFGSSLVLTAHILLVFALVAICAAQAGPGGSVNSIGMILGVAGTTLNVAVIFVEIAGAGGQDVRGVLNAGLTGTLTLLGGVAFLLGLILIGIATLQAGIYPRWAGAVLIAGALVFGASVAAGSAASTFVLTGAALTCTAFIGLGWSLLRGAVRSQGGVLSAPLIS